MYMTIPTAFGVIRPTFSKNYWWLRSPFMGGTNGAWFVTPDGDIGYGVHSVSYGRESPDTHDPYYAWRVNPGGYIYDDDSEGAGLSYGRNLLI